MPTGTRPSRRARHHANDRSGENSPPEAQSASTNGEGSPPRPAGPPSLRERRHPELEHAITTDDLVRRRRLWPLAEAADQLGVTRKTLYQWRKSGLIADVRLGRRVYISDGELERFVIRAELASRQAQSA